MTRRRPGRIFGSGRRKFLSIERDGRILLLQRSQDSTLDPGLWELPGGKMDHGEVLTDALAREVAEETGITVEVGRPLVTFHFVKEPFWVTGVAFECRHVSGEVVLSEENSDFAWVGSTDLDRYTLSTGTAEQVLAWRDSR
ncbi:MAG: NUDIX domain-containing protein [Deltaproteobacteria bacterium]|nr:NUDIX domain-containing protein [Deltaproteobacteria bacterium]